MSVPKEAVDTVWAFFDALMEDNEAALLATLDPDSDAALLYELFGEAALYAASAALRGPCVVRLTRALVLGDNVWLEGEQVTQDTREPIGHVVFGCAPLMADGGSPRSPLGIWKPFTTSVTVPTPKAMSPSAST